MLFHNRRQRNARWNGPFDLARVVQPLTQCENTLVFYFISAFNENNNSNDDKCYRTRSLLLIFNIQQEGRETERKIFITLIPRDFSDTDFRLDYGQCWMTIAYSVSTKLCVFVHWSTSAAFPFSREFQMNENSKSLELEIETMICFEGKKDWLGWVLKIVKRGWKIVSSRHKK